CVRECGSAGELVRQRIRLLFELLSADDAIEKAPPLAFIRRHDTAGIKELRSVAVADDPRQQGASAHIATGQADTRKPERGFGLRRAETNVTEQRDHGAGANTDTVNRPDDRLRTGPHRLNEFAGHAGEFEQPLHVATQQRTDDVVDIAAGTEVAGARAEYDD